MKSFFKALFYFANGINKDLVTVDRKIDGLNCECEKLCQDQEALEKFWGVSTSGGQEDKNPQYAVKKGGSICSMER